MAMESPILLFIRPATRFWLRYVVKYCRKADIKAPVLVSGMLERTHKMTEHIIAMGLILFDTDSTGKIRSDVFEDAELLRKHECHHRLRGI